MKGLLLNYTFGMWDAVVTGKKTNTRRSHKTLFKVNETPNDFDFIGSVTKKDGTIFAKFKPKTGGQIMEGRARYQIGEVVFLQEPTMNLNPYVTNEDTIMRQYRDKDGVSEVEHFKPLIEAAKAKGATWANKMFMSQSHARYFVKITGVEVERLQDISVKDCLAEGIEQKKDNDNFITYGYRENGKPFFFTNPKKAYFSLYKEINKVAPDNPWVFSYHFELCTIEG